MSQKDDLLFEIGCEELPAKGLFKLANELANRIDKLLTDAKLTHGSVTAYATPRRLAVIVSDLVAAQNEQNIERKGPAVKAAFTEDGTPTKAAAGFAQSCGVDITELETLETKQGSWLYFKSTESGKQTEELLPNILASAIKKLPFPKAMRWGSQNIEFLRPVHWIVLLYGKKLIPGTLLGKATQNFTLGHRFLHPEAILLSKASDYVRVLEKEGKVIADFNHRRDLIQQQIVTAAAAKNATAMIDPKLLDEVTGLVEWPVALLGSYSKEFLSMPAEVLITCMQHHQKSFAVTDPKGKLLPYFITISNIESINPEQVIIGNQRVMHARLSDAAFFYQSDSQHTLEQHVETLKHIVFQKKLGSLYDKTERVQQLCRVIAKSLSVDAALVERAALLCKTDLCTDMVGEFPELQGIIGAYYAKQQNEPTEVAESLREYYLPRFSGDETPTSDVAAVLAIADRLDTLVGIFAIKQIPSGDKDPFALRRAALGIIRIIIEKQLTLNLTDIIQCAITLLPSELQNNELSPQVHQFIIDRLRAWYQEQGYTADTFAAVLARQNQEFYDIHLRMQAVKEFRLLPEAEALAAANKRVSNILSKEAPADNDLNFTDSLLQDSAEQELAQQLNDKNNTIAPLYSDGKYTQALSELASLQQAIDRFFDEVMVMVDDEQLKKNRLALLQRLRSVFLKVADISLLQGK